MKIKSIYVNHFKSLVDFRIDFTNFNCLIGLNGSGKSTFLQFVDFLVHLMKGDIENWLDGHGWREKDLFDASINPTHEKIIRFQVTFSDDFKDDKILAWWDGEYRYEDNSAHCLINERIEIGDMIFLGLPIYHRYYPYPHAKTQKYTVGNISNTLVSGLVNFKYKGSIFSVLDDVDIPQEFYDMKKFILSMESSEILSAYLLKQQTDNTADSIGSCGKKLVAFLANIGKTGRMELEKQLIEVYPQLQFIGIEKTYADWKCLYIKEKFQDKEQTMSSFQINDGMLRLLAVLSQLRSDKNILLFDEIENGIDTQAVEFLVKKLISAKQQIVVTTHSPLFLNRLDNDTARKSVKYFYKTLKGYTRCIPFFDIPHVQEKLKCLGLGEAYADTNLIELNSILNK